MVVSAVVLDRDGVINQVRLVDGRPHPPQSVDDLHLIEGVIEAVAQLREAGIRVFCMTNQPDVARGVVNLETVTQINEVIREQLHLDEIYVCVHDDADNCACRKPKPGGILYFIEKYALEPSETYVIGDRWRDVEAGRNAGCRTIYIESEYDEKKPDSPDRVAVSLWAAASLIMEER